MITVRKTLDDFPSHVVGENLSDDFRVTASLVKFADDSDVVICVLCVHRFLLHASGHTEPMPAQRQRAIAFARHREKRVRDRGDERDRADFAGSPHTFSTALYDVYFNRRRLVHMWDLELVEVRLDRTTVLE